MIFSTSAFSETSFADIGEQLYVFPDGLVATTNLNSVTVELLIEAAADSLLATGALGDVSIITEVSFTPVGVDSNTVLGFVTIWTESSPIEAVVQGSLTRRAQAASQPPGFFIDNIAASPTYTNITTGVSQSYTEVSSGVSQSYTTLTTGVSQSYTEVEPSSSPTWTDKAA